jgi:hypothetical protein
MENKRAFLIAVSLDTIIYRTIPCFAAFCLWFGYNLFMNCSKIRVHEHSCCSDAENLLFSGNSEGQSPFLRHCHVEFFFQDEFKGVRASNGMPQ